MASRRAAEHCMRLTEPRDGRGLRLSGWAAKWAASAENAAECEAPPTPEGGRPPRGESQSIRAAAAASGTGASAASGGRALAVALAGTVASETATPGAGTDVVAADVGPAPGDAQRPTRPSRGALPGSRPAPRRAAASASTWCGQSRTTFSKLTIMPRSLTARKAWRAAATRLWCAWTLRDPDTTPAPYVASLPNRSHEAQPKARPRRR